MKGKRISTLSALVGLMSEIKENHRHHKKHFNLIYYLQIATLIIFVLGIIVEIFFTIKNGGG